MRPPDLLRICLMKSVLLDSTFAKLFDLLRRLLLLVELLFELEFTALSPGVLIKMLGLRLEIETRSLIGWFKVIVSG